MILCNCPQIWPVAAHKLDACLVVADGRVCEYAPVYVMWGDVLCHVVQLLVGYCCCCCCWAAWLSRDAHDPMWVVICELRSRDCMMTSDGLLIHMIQSADSVPTLTFMLAPFIPSSRLYTTSGNPGNLVEFCKFSWIIFWWTDIFICVLTILPHVCTWLICTYVTFRWHLVIVI